MNDDMSQKREEARCNYRPNKIRYLLIAESPPEAEERFIYFPLVDEGDILYVELMRAIFPQTSGEKLDIDTLRELKPRFLKRFMEEGFYLIDAVDKPLPQGMKYRQRRKKVKKALQDLIRKIRCLKLNGAKVIIIKATVHHEAYAELKLEGLDIVNDKPIDFPGRFTTPKFREKMAVALTSYFEEKERAHTYP